jgi:7-keto-8-aminopelargonate synthetase-like enzyme
MNPVEQWAKDEYREGVSAGAAARQLCRTLGAVGGYETLQRMIEDMLADRNRASFDRSCILRAVDMAAHEDAPRIRRESFARNNPTAPISGAGAGNN